MITYIIRGTYPAYTITGTTQDGNVVFEDYASDFAQIMKGFIHRMEPGDHIHWEPA